MEPVETYRKRAADARHEAEKMPLPHLKEQFLKIADQYDELAEMVAKSEGRKS